MVELDISRWYFGFSYGGDAFEVMIHEVLGICFGPTKKLSLLESHTMSAAAGPQLRALQGISYRKVGDLSLCSLSTPWGLATKNRLFDLDPSIFNHKIP